MSRVRLIPVLSCLLALAACGSPSATPTASPTDTPSASVTPTASATPTATAKVQDSLDGITVKGAKRTKPTVTFDTPFVIDKTRVEVLDKGTGAEAQADGSVTVHYLGVNGRTGETFDESYSRETPVSFSLAGVVPGFATGLTGQKAGSRVLIAMPGSEGYDSQGGNEAAGIAVGDTLIFVVDILDVSLEEPSGRAVRQAPGLPQVTGGPSDKPTVTIPSGTPPTRMSDSYVIKGEGAKVAKTDAITARYVGYSWKTGKLIDDGFDNPTTGNLSSLIPGWQTGLVGKTVGSRVLLVLPPADGFPEGSNNPPVDKGDTVVYVVDLLFTQAGS